MPKKQLQRKMRNVDERGFWIPEEFVSEYETGDISDEIISARVSSRLFLSKQYLLIVDIRRPARRRVTSHDGRRIVGTTKSWQ